MESNSESGKINISNDTYHLIKEHFSCQYRGKIDGKNKGEIDMYFVKNLYANNESYTVHSQ
jgi:adenylate cyclase